MVDDGTTIFYPDHSSANIVELTGHEIENSHVLSEGLMEMYRFHGFMMNPWLVGLDWPEELSDMGDLQHQHEQQQFSALAMLGHAGRVKMSMLPVSLPGRTSVSKMSLAHSQRSRK